MEELDEFSIPRMMSILYWYCNHCTKSSRGAAVTWLNRLALSFISIWKFSRPSPSGYEAMS
jgi:hypothetical protein